MVGLWWRDPEAIVFGLLTAAATAIVLRARRFVRLALLALLVLLADLLFWMVPAAVSAAVHGDGGVAVVLTVWLSAVGTAGVVALILGAIGWPTWAGPSGLLFGALAILGFVVLTVAMSPDAGQQPAAGATAVVLEARAVSFSVDTIDVPAGPVQVTVHNRDLFWHTFTVPGLGEVRLPTGATRTLTLDLPPGRHRFLCALPGHEGPMSGVVVAR